MYTKQDSSLFTFFCRAEMSREGSGRSTCAVRQHWAAIPFWCVGNDRGRAATFPTRHSLDELILLHPSCHSSNNNSAALTDSLSSLLDETEKAAPVSSPVEPAGLCTSHQRVRSPAFLYFHKEYYVFLFVRKPHSILLKKWTYKVTYKTCPTFLDKESEK